MGKAYLIDTSAVSRYMREELPSWAMDLMASVLEQASTISIVTRIELLVYEPHDEKEADAFRMFLMESNTLNLNESVVQQTVRIRRQHRGVKLPDAIIAATAVANDLILLSTNDKDFGKISGLRYRSLNT